MRRTRRPSHRRQRSVVEVAAAPLDPLDPLAPAEDTRMEVVVAAVFLLDRPTRARRANDLTCN